MLTPEAKAERARAVRMIRGAASARLAIAEKAFFAGEKRKAEWFRMAYDHYMELASRVESGDDSEVGDGP